MKPYEDSFYVDMCEKAEELQKIRSTNYGNYFCSHNTTSFYDLIIINDCNNYSSQNEKDIWLPRQDQLQEMAIPYYDSVGHSTVANIINLAYNMNLILRESSISWDYWMQFKTFEQFWLAFVMYKKYNKVWNNKNWILN